MLKNVFLAQINLERKVISKIKSLSINNSDLNLASVPIQNFDNLAYYGPVSIGTPPQDFQLIYDSGSPLLYVASNQCYPCIGVSDQRFNPDKSSTSYDSQQPDSIQYGSGSASGTIYSDVVGINGQFSVQMTDILVANQVDLGTSQCSGIMGLSNQQSVENVFQFAKSAGILSSSLFAMQIRPIPQQITMSSYWAFNMYGIYVGETQVTTKSSQNALVDSGTSVLVFGSQSLLISIYEQVGNCILDQYDKLPNISIYGHGIEFVITGPQYATTQIQDGERYCSLEFSYLQLSSNEPSVILGDTFMRTLNVVFDKENQQIGFSGPQVFLLFCPDTALMVYSIIVLAIGGIILIAGLYLTILFRSMKKSIGQDYGAYQDINKVNRILQNQYQPPQNPYSSNQYTQQPQQKSRIQ